MGGGGCRSGSMGLVVMVVVVKIWFSPPGFVYRYGSIGFLNLFSSGW